ncbi:MAG: dTMP kinase [Candidatus Aenigmatarchaeota archaeon]|nr:MAG: dTMP kinase [Candidatus Aenigmarchaeota archaeon]
MSGKLVVLEGIDGAGGEVQSKKLVEYLKQKGIPARRLTYPEYEKPVGRLIDEYLKGGYDFSPKFLFVLYASDMIKDIDSIKASLEKGEMLVCDRYFTTTLTYQVGVMKSISLENALKFAEIFEIKKPDIVFYLRISPETSIERKSKEKEVDVHEGSRVFLKSVTEAYERLAKENVFGNWFVIDGEKSIEEVFDEIIKTLKNKGIVPAD